LLSLSGRREQCQAKARHCCSRSKGAQSHDWCERAVAPAIRAREGHRAGHENALLRPKRGVSELRPCAAARSPIEHCRSECRNRARRDTGLRAQPYGLVVRAWPSAYRGFGPRSRAPVAWLLETSEDHERDSAEDELRAQRRGEHCLPGPRRGAAGSSVHTRVRLAPGSLLGSTGDRGLLPPAELLLAADSVRQARDWLVRPGPPGWPRWRSAWRMCARCSTRASRGG